MNPVIDERNRWIDQLTMKLNKYRSLCDEWKHREQSVCGDIAFENVIGDLTKERDELKHDIEAYRGALGYSVAGNHDGKLSNGDTPKCGMCNSEYRAGLERGRDELEKELDQLTKERDELATQLCAWHSTFGTSQLSHAIVIHDTVVRKLQQAENERDQLAAKVAALWDVLQATKLEHMGEVSNQWFIMRDKVLSCQCGEGWLSPEKKKLLVEALLRMVYGREDDPKDSNGLSAGEISVGDLRAAKQALEACDK